jgi:hypothetical protein
MKSASNEEEAEENSRFRSLIMCSFLKYDQRDKNYKNEMGEACGMKSRN